MAREMNFSFRVNESERHLLAVLAERLQRTPSDAVRLVVREAVRSLLEETSSRPPSGTEECREATRAHA